jgi:hypothetical protein
VEGSEEAGIEGLIMEDQAKLEKQTPYVPLVCVVVAVLTAILALLGR